MSFAFIFLAGIAVVVAGGVIIYIARGGNQ
jgi:hypothetical protein